MEDFTGNRGREGESNTNASSSLIKPFFGLPFMLRRNGAIILHGQAIDLRAPKLALHGE